MTEEELAAIKARCEAATKGPWRGGCRTHIQDTASVWIWTGEKTERICTLAVREGCDHDGIFIAHARTDIPKFLAEIERWNTPVSQVRELVK